MTDEPRYIFLEDLDGTYYVLDMREGAVAASGITTRRDAILKVGQLLQQSAPSDPPAHEGMGEIP